MKLNYKIALMAVGVLAATSCAKHDPLPDHGQMGVEVPTCYWSVGSSACKAGEDFTFKGLYYTANDLKADHSEVWYLIKREESASATVKLAGGSLSFTKAVSATDTVRESQSIAVFPHSEDLWNGTAYEINGTVPTSTTLSPVDWKNITTWDQENFKKYFPEGFDKEFVEEVVGLLTKDSTYYNGMKQVYIRYDFSNAQFAAVNAKYNVNFPTDIEHDPSDSQVAVTDKSERWFETTEASDEAIVGYYYKYVDSNGNTVVKEVGMDVQAKEENGKTVYYNGSNICYPVYASAPWVFCRYDDDAGAIVRAVRANYIPAFKDLFLQIAFPDWIFDSTENTYTVVFSRAYKLDAQFKVWDSAGNIGVASDIRTIDIN